MTDIWLKELVSGNRGSGLGLILFGFECSMEFLAMGIMVR